MADGILVNSKFTLSVFKNSFKRIQTVPEVLYPAIHVEAYEKPFDPTDPLIQALQKM
jgi:alpha-1,3/alpha-1,6-mannosyltransferase